jgi:hypothetical protein
VTDTAAHAPRSRTFDVPAVLTVHITSTSDEHARDTLTGALNFGMLLDVNAGDGIFIHQAAALRGHPPTPIGGAVLMTSAHRRTSQRQAVYPPVRTHRLRHGRRRMPSRRGRSRQHHQTPTSARNTGSLNYEMIM